MAEVDEAAIRARGWKKFPVVLEEEFKGQFLDPDLPKHLWWRFAEDPRTETVRIFLLDDRTDEVIVRLAITERMLKDPTYDVVGRVIVPMLSHKAPSALDAWTKALDDYCGGIRP